VNSPKRIVKTRSKQALRLGLH